MYPAVPGWQGADFYRGVMFPAVSRHIELGSVFEGDWGSLSFKKVWP